MDNTCFQMSSVRLKDFRNLQPHRIYYFDNKFIVTNGRMLLYRQAKQDGWNLMTREQINKWGDRVIRSTDDFEYNIQ